MPGSSTAAAKSSGEKAPNSGKADNILKAFIHQQLDDLDVHLRKIGPWDRVQQLDPTARQQKLATLRLMWPTFIKHGPNPTLQWQECTTAVNDGSRRVQLVNPEYFKLMNCEVIFWAPHIFFDVPKPNCPVCCTNKHVECKGWQRDYARRVATPTHTMWVVGFRYRCVECPGESHDRMMPAQDIVSRTHRQAMILL